MTRRFEDIKQVLETLRDMEKRLKSNPRSHLQRSRLVAASRASAYVMMYNAIESAMREVFESMRSSIEQENLQFHAVSEYWRLDILQAKFLKKMQDGFSHGTILTNIAPLAANILQWTESERERLPFSGNFGQDHVFRFKDVLGLNWGAPAGTLGGADLENIRKRRNALAHGLETFEEAGSAITAKELLDILGRVSRFMTSYVTALEEYQTNRGYLNVVPLPVGLAAGLVENQDAF
ncbi:MAE_28990/MAE_18760 family HEPN-like nuclease [Rhizobium sp. N941]|nr:MAE_28990/MAE_18760 family HEPN-like nuclease [Rhizobium sp. N941]